MGAISDKAFCENNLKTGKNKCKKGRQKSKISACYMQAKIVGVNYCKHFEGENMFSRTKCYNLGKGRYYRVATISKMGKFLDTIIISFWLSRFFIGVLFFGLVVPAMVGTVQYTHFQCCLYRHFILPFFPRYLSTFFFNVAFSAY